jgi:hypothetical protein
MTTEIGNSALLRTWANDGTVVVPSNAKIDEGWLRGEQPPHEWMNYIHNILGQKINHALSRGAADWVSSTEYLAGAVVNRSGAVWLALATNTNSEPTGANSNWVAVADRSDLGNAREFRPLSANTTLNAADIGQTILASASLTLTFPDSTSLPSGAQFTVLNSSGTTITLAGSTFVTSSGATITSLTGYSAVICAVPGSNQYRVAHMGDGPFSLASNGYQKLASGLIVQWGFVNFASPSSVTSRAVTFPVSFTSAVYSISISQADNANTIMGRSFETTPSGFTALASLAGYGASYIAIGI